MTRRLRFIAALIVCTIGVLGLAGAPSGTAVTLPAPATPLDPTTIPKYTDQLVIPPGYVPRVTYEGGRKIHEYTVSMERFQQQILPAGYPMTSVYGYKGDSRFPGGPVIPGFQNTPSSTFEAVRGVPIKVHYVNNLTGSSMLPIDPTLHWADPNGTGMPMGPFPTFPPGFPQAQSPIPAVVHLHGGEVRSDSDGGPEAWHTSNGLRGQDAAPFDPGTNNTVTFNYPNAQQPTTRFYHDHALGMTRINLLSGLAGFYLLRDPADSITSILPSGKYEVPVAIQDRSFNDDGSLNFPAEGVNPDVHPYWSTLCRQNPINQGISP